MQTENFLPTIDEYVNRKYKQIFDYFLYARLTTCLYLLPVLIKMRSNFVIIIALICGSQLNFTYGKKYNLSLCMNNRTVKAEIIDSVPENDFMCFCQVGPYNALVTREDYLHTPGIGSHKLHTDAQPWNDARKVCDDEGGHLAIINSKEEETVRLTVKSYSCKV